MALKKRIPILNPDKDYSAAAAFNPDRVLPRPIYDPPWGEHPDDDRFLVAEFDPDAPWMELCPVCHGEDTQIPPCAWCDGELYVEHSCSDA